MPQGRFERGFWAAVRGGDMKFKPYPPEHWRKPKTNRKRKSKKKVKSDFIKEHVKILGIPDYKEQQLTFFD